MIATALVIEDDDAVRRMLASALRQANIEPVLAPDGRTGLELLANDSIDLVLLDLELPDLTGLEVLRRVKERDPLVGVLLVTGHGDVPTAVRAMQLGAEHFLTKPLDLVQLRTLLGRTLEAVRLRRRSEYHAARAADSFRLAGLGESPAMQGVVDAVDTFAASEAIVLLEGETGVGKGWTAELIHALSARARGAFVAVNCAGLTRDGLESELFGAERAPSGGPRAGLLEAAHGGTLFLDEIGDLAPELQPRLLHVLESGSTRRPGGGREVTVDVRLIAATRRDLQEAVARGRFREDLFWRIAAHPVRIPPLRERGSDAIVEMSYRVLGDLRRKLGRGPTRISAAALERLVRHPWPGNIRELGNVLEHVVLHAGTAAEVLPRHLPAGLAPAPGAADPGAEPDWNLAALLQATERRHIAAALSAAGGNRSRAAELLGISRATLYEKLKRHDLAG